MRERWGGGLCILVGERASTADDQDTIWMVPYKKQRRHPKVYSLPWTWLLRCHHVDPPQVSFRIEAVEEGFFVVSLLVPQPHCTNQGLGFTIQGLGFRVWGLGFGVVQPLSPQACPADESQESERSCRYSSAAMIAFLLAII